MDYHKIREEYKFSCLKEEDLNICPFSQFKKWFDFALGLKINVPNAVSLSTSNKEGRPSSRMVLLKDFNIENGFVFFSNYQSKKGQNIEQNPYGALLFFWNGIERQIRVEGKIQKSSRKVSEAYFHSRPRASQISASISEQSNTIKSYSDLEHEYTSFEKKHQGKEIPCPDFWGGYELIPDYFEFWQGRENRLHDRFDYQIIGSNWQISRLCP